MKKTLFAIPLIFLLPCFTYAQEDNDQTGLMASNVPDTESERRKMAIKIFKRNGKFVPAYKNYLKNNADYEKGFNEGMFFATSPRQGTDIILKNKLKDVSTKSREYSSGFFSALESYYAISTYKFYEKLEKEKAN